MPEIAGTRSIRRTPGMWAARWMSQVMAALHFVRRNMLIQATKTLGRVEVPQFSERAVFEALVNAVAHRDYSMAGARVRLHMFGDRLELYVPGGLANTLTPDSMALRQYNRNELIVSLLARCPVGAEEGVGRSYLMDRRGDGVPIILAESQKLSGRVPEYSVIDDSELRLVIWAATL
jgi:ATP-dependent DNA helicase RecG